MLAPVLDISHKMAAKVTGLPFLELQQEECKQLSESITEVFAQYDVEIPPSLAVWLKLLAVSSAIYVPRFMIYEAMKKEFARQQSEVVA